MMKNSNRVSKYWSLLLQTIVLVCPFATFAQEDTAMVRTYGGPYYEEGRQIIECAVGGYAIIGTTGSDQLNNTNFYVLRLDEDLNCMWSKSIGGINVEWGLSIVEDDAGNFLLCGYTNSFGEGGYDVLVYKVDESGEIIWQKTYGGSDWDFGYKIIAHPEQGYLICGKTYSMGNGNSDGYLLHVDANGEIIDEWTYGGVGADEFVDVDFHADQNAFLVLQRQSTNSQVLVLGFDGLISTSININDDVNLQLNDLFIGDQHIFIGGKWLGNEDERGAYTCALDHTLGILWEVVDEPSNKYEIFSLTATNNEMIAAGSTEAFGWGGSDIMFQRRTFDSFWSAGPTFGSGYDEFAYSTIIDSQGRPTMVGTSDGLNSNLTNSLYLIRLQDAVLTVSYVEIENFELGCFAVHIDSSQPYYEGKIIQSGSTLTCTARHLKEFSLFDLNGSLCYTGSANSFSIERFSSGLYFAKVLVADGSILTMKLVIF